MAAADTCPKCGAHLPSDALQGLCPLCLGKAVFGAGAAETLVLPVSEKAGDRIGRYKLLQQIGEGGCGVVYMAEQEEPVRRRVAFKIIKLGMDTREVVARFEAERQALALMDHPNIARVFDGGATSTGRPYFVMELVRGTKITEYCDQNNLSTADRLKLFIQVCHAIQHAHQKGIIHRDIKPSNVLVMVHDDVPMPKVIDFGIAKAVGERLTDKTLFTRFEQFIGTPSYMSPEQAGLSGLDIDTRSDIYALGVLLYELLTGRTPFDPRQLVQAGLEEMLRTIREEEPPKPSTRLTELVAADVRRLKSSGGQPPTEEEIKASSRRLLQVKETIRLVRGDLDWIVMQCLEKNRARRYETASALALDLERHLEHQPVTAAAPTTGYRMAKFIRRHRTALAVAGALAGLLVAGAVTSTWQAIRATRAEHTQHRLRQEAERARASEAGLSQQAQAALYKSRLSENRALRLARPPGWSEVTFQNLSNNASMRLPERDLVELRSEAVACLGELDVCEIARWPGRGGGIWSLDFRPGADMLASADLVCVSRLWKIGGKDVLWEKKDAVIPAGFVPLSHGVAWGAVRFDPAGEHLAYSTLHHSVEMVSVQSPAELILRLTPPAQPQDIAFDRAGRILAVAWSDDRVVAYETRSGNVLREIRPRRRVGPTWRNVVAVSPDGSTVAIVGDNHTIELHKLTNDVPPVVLGRHQDSLMSVAFSRGGDLLVSASTDRTAKVFDVNKEKELFTLLGHKARVYYAAFRPDGEVIATVSEDETARLWDARTGETKLVLQPRTGSLLSVAFSANGQKLAVAYGQIVVYRLSNEGARQTLYGHHGVITSLAFHPSQPVLASASADNSSILWNLASGQRDKVLGGHPGGRPYGLAFSRDGALLAAGHGGYDNYKPSEHGIRLWETASGALGRVLSGHRIEAECVAFDPSGRLLVSGDRAGVSIVRDCFTGKYERRWQQPGDPMVGVQFCSPGYLLAMGHRSGLIQIGDCLTGQIIAQAKVTNKLNALAISPVQQRLVVGTDRGTVPVFALPALSSLAIVNASEGGAVRAVALSQDGRLLASGGSGCQVRLWDALTGAELLKFPGQERTVFGLAFDPTGSRLAICGGEEQITVWDLGLVQERLKSLGIGWDWPAVKHATGREEGAWAEMLTQRWLRQTNGTTGDGLAASSLAALLAQAPTNGAAETATIHSLSLKGTAWAPEEPEVWRLRAEVLANQGDWAGALAAIDRAIERQPNNPAFWNMKGTWLVKSNSLDEALRAFTRGIDLARADTNAFSQALKEAHAGRWGLFRKMNRFAEAADENLALRGLPARDPSAQPNLLDLSGYYHAGLDQVWHDTNQGGNNLATLPHGLQKLAEVEFDVRGVVQLAGAGLDHYNPIYPSQVKDIRVGLKSHRLHFLHATGWRVSDGVQIGTYLLHYADGQQQAIPILYGKQVRDWWGSKDNEPLSANTVVAWNGTNTFNQPFRIFKTAWTNPRPDVEIKSLDFVSALTESAPFVIAITVE